MAPLRDTHTPRASSGQPWPQTPLTPLCSSTQAAIEEEAKTHGDFVFLPIVDVYGSLSNKSRVFFKVANDLFPSLEFVVKMDDDVYLLPHRLLMAADQWASVNAE